MFIYYRDMRIVSHIYYIWWMILTRQHCLDQPVVPILRFLFETLFGFLYGIDPTVEMTSLLREYILFLNTIERKRAYLEKSHMAPILTVTMTNISWRHQKIPTKSHENKSWLYILILTKKMWQIVVTQAQFNHVFGAKTSRFYHKFFCVCLELDNKFSCQIRG